METLDSPDIVEKKPRRTLLIALVIFTFVTSLFRLGVSIAFFSQVNFGYLERADNSFRWLILYVLLVGVSGIPSITAGILILLGKRFGFWVYIVGQVTFLAGMSSLILALGRELNQMPAFALSIIVLLFILPFVFIFLYRFALKSMKKNAGTAEL